MKTEITNIVFPRITDHKVKFNCERNNIFEVRTGNNNSGLYAKQEIKIDEVICYLIGETSDSPTKYTVQIYKDKHVNPPEAADESAYLWKYINHSCQPVIYVDFTDFSFRAIRDIGHGEEITFNYNTSEYEIARPFKCNCRSQKCYGLVQGYKYLTEIEKKEIMKYTAEHLIRIDG